MKCVTHGGQTMFPSAHRFLSLLSLVILAAGTLPPSYAADSNARPGSLTVLNYVTGWIHDAVGYHPAVFMMVENTSGQDLSNTPIRLQARFTDLQTAEVAIGRKEIRRDLKPHQQASLSIAGNQAYELPFEVDLWPVIEAKVMCRIGQVGDEGTETLMISKVEPTTHTEEEAFQSLNQNASYAPRPRTASGAPPVASPRQTRNSRPTPAAQRPAPEKPLIATAERLPASTGRNRASSSGGSAQAFFNSKSLPGLGDDFYQFEQRFGMPVEFDAKHSDWTWARYKDASGIEIISGAREHRGNVDVLVVRVPKNSISDEMAVANSAKAFAGSLRAQTVSPPARSVRYLPSGRLEVITRKANDYRVLCFAPSDQADNSFILVLSRRPQDVEQLLTAQAQKVSLLKCLHFLDASKE